MAVPVLVTSPDADTREILVPLAMPIKPPTLTPYVTSPVTDAEEATLVMLPPVALPTSEPTLTLPAMLPPSKATLAIVAPDV